MIGPLALAGRIAAAQRGARTRRAMHPPRTACAWPGCSAGREQGAYCRSHWAEYMRDYRARKSAKDSRPARKLSREMAAAAAEEVTMNTLSQETGNGLLPHAVPAGETGASVAPSAAPAVDLDALAAQIEPDDAAPARRALSPTAYLTWLLLETREALRLAEHCRRTGQNVRLEEFADPAVAPISPELPDFERRLLEVSTRLGMESLVLARRQARIEAARAAAFNPGVKIGATADAGGDGEQ